MSRYADCLAAAEPASCLALKGFDGTAGAPWGERMAMLVRAGSTAQALKFARTVRPTALLMLDNHRRPTDEDLAALETVDPEGAVILRPAAANDVTWLRFIATQTGGLISRGLPSESIAGFTLAAEAYRSADPFAAPDVKSALAQAKDERAVILRAMRSLLPDAANGFPGVTPPGAPAILARAQAQAQPSATFLSTLAAFAWWSGDDAAANKALAQLATRRGEAKATWAQDARVFTALGRAADAQAILNVQETSAEKLRLEHGVGEAWLRAGNKAQAAASARAILADPAADPEAYISAARLLKTAGGDADAEAAIGSLAQRAEAADKASKSAAFAAASEGYSAIGRTDQACALARRSLAAVGSSAEAQAEAWKHQYGTQLSVNYFVGFVYTDDPLSVDDLRKTFRERAARALEDCGSRDEAARAGGGHAPAAWEMIAKTPNLDASDSLRLKEEAALVAGDAAAESRLAEAARAAPLPDDPSSRATWLSALALVQASAGRADEARATFASAVRSVDQASMPDDQHAAAAQLAIDARSIEAEIAGRRFGRPLP
jgi:hypothetical protein